MTSSSHFDQSLPGWGDEGIADHDSSRLIERVRKLLAKAEASTNSHEADAFSGKAAELVARHRIDPNRLVGDRTIDELAVREVPLGRGAYVRARLSLLMAVAEAHDARVVFGSTPTGTVAYVAGFANDIDIVEVMYHSLHAQMAAQVASERRATAAATQRHRRSFMFGYADRVGRLLLETRRTVEAEPESEAAGGQVLAVPDRMRRVDAFVEESFGRVRAARTASGAELGSWSAGSAAAAASADVGRDRLAGRRALGAG